MRKRYGSALFVVLALLSTSVSPAHAATSTLPDWAKSATIYEVNIRQYTAQGTFNAFAASLSRLQKLGVKILWFMPVQPISVLNRKGTLGSEYSVANYTAVNPEFGSAADFKTLVDKAHAMGFKVILDWVADHSGWDNPWINNPSWYHQDVNGNIISPNPDWGDVAWLNYENPDMRAAMLNAMKYWVTNFDIDGFRADDATGVPADFWQQAITTLTAIKPLFMLAESQGDKSLLQAGFNADYGWDLLKVLNGIGAGTQNREDFENLAIFLQEEYSSGKFPMTFITNHDENSNTGSEYSRLGAGVKALSAIYFTYPGMPLIYSGQEVGNTKQIAFFDKDLIPGLTQANPVSTFYASLIALKNRNPVLWNTSVAPLTPLPVTSDNVIAFARESKGDNVVTLANITSTPQNVTITYGSLGGTYHLLTSGALFALPKSSTVTLGPWQYQVYSTK